MTRKEQFINSVVEAIKQMEGWKGGVFPSRSFRNSNPGNLRFANQIGNVGKDKDNFAIFPNEVAGMEALKRDINSKLEWAFDLYDLFSVYAPSSDNNDPLRYAQFVAERAGIKHTTPLKLAMLDTYKVAILFVKPNQPLPPFIDFIENALEIVVLNSDIRLNVSSITETCWPKEFHDHWDILKENEFKEYNCVMAFSYPENWGVKRLVPSGVFYQHKSDDVQLTEVIFDKKLDDELKRIILHELAHAILFHLGYDNEIWQDEVDGYPDGGRTDFYAGLFKKYLKI